MSTPTPEKKTVRSGPHPGEPESPATLETFARRTERPGKVGLANEGRPGLGTRATDAETGQSISPTQDPKAEPSGKDAPSPLHKEPRPAPSEQDSDSLAQEQQRSTGVSGHLGGT